MSSGGRRGLIYILANEHMRGILKIGKTIRGVEVRARELSRPSGVPSEFEVIYHEVVSDVDAAEVDIHEELRDLRVSRSREFFRVSIFDAIRLVQEIARRYEVDESIEAGEIEVLPQLESRIRRWLRRELVSVKFVQFPDLCILRVTDQPDLQKMEAFQVAVDLRVFGDQDDPDDLLFNPRENSITKNVEKFLALDPYSMIMTGLGLLSDEAGEYIARLREDLEVDPPMDARWRVSQVKYDIWGTADNGSEMLLAWLQEQDAQRLGDNLA